MPDTTYCRYCPRPNPTSSLWCSPECQQADTDRMSAIQTLGRQLAATECCVNCEYEGKGDTPCMFPTPQKGGEPPFMTQAAMPDPSGLGVNCVQFRSASEAGA